MQRKTRAVLLLAVGVALLLIAGAGLRWLQVIRYRNLLCKQRGAALTERVNRIRHEANDKPRIGARKNDVINFFAENGIPLTFDRSSASGSLMTSGCAPFGCGLDSALIGVRVDLDEEGAVKSEPVVVGMYTDCL